MSNVKKKSNFMIETVSHLFVVYVKFLKYYFIIKKYLNKLRKVNIYRLFSCELKIYLLLHMILKLCVNNTYK